MGADTFKFKQFAVVQKNAAMKVSADAVTFGALVTHFSPLEVGRVLDIGAGTGLLSLMLAQGQKKAEIDAVEIEAGAFEDLCNNFFHAPWNARLHAFCQDIFSFRHTTSQYELIVCNPPFFGQDILSPDKKRALARSTHTFSLAKLAEVVRVHLAAKGVFWVLLPTLTEMTKHLASQRIFPRACIELAHSKKHQAHLWLGAYGFGLTEEALIWQRWDCFEANASPTKAHQNLLAPYYLYY